MSLHLVVVGRFPQLSLHLLHCVTQLSQFLPELLGSTRCLLQATLRVLVSLAQLVMCGDLHIQCLSQSFDLRGERSLFINVLLESRLLIQFLLFYLGSEGLNLSLIVQHLIEQNSVRWQSPFLGFLDLFLKGRDLSVLLRGLKRYVSVSLL